MDNFYVLLTFNFFAVSLALLRHIHKNHVTGFNVHFNPRAAFCLAIKMQILADMVDIV